MEVVLLYLTPLACRLALGPAPTVEEVARTLSPLLITLPSVALPRFFRDHRREHVVRHAVYTVGQLACLSLNVRWGSVVLQSDEAWASALTAYAAMGVATLAWFCVAHVMENAKACLHLRTHHGDVAVLPLTFAAIASFATAVPDEALVWSRSILHYVPIIVGWATLNFVGHLDFATDGVTTHHRQGFHQVAHAALVVACVHLVLLEVRAGAVAFQFFPLSAALLYMRMPSCDRAGSSPLRERAKGALLSAVGAAGAGAVAHAAAGWWPATMGSLRGLPVAASFFVAGVCVPPSTRSVDGQGPYAVPAAALASLCASSYLHVPDALPAAALFGGYALLFYALT